ncbi:phage portal protein [Devosia riboflavina]|uniref:phage portal protein n=1 Tax=Devosia riboflavina TaxID=46914 RepID=UPI00068F51FF|nr:phage portal protein [Devosia riboflavina]
MANWISRIFGGKQKAAEGEYRPGPYQADNGWLSASAGRLMNWWQAGHSPGPYGESGAMVEACVSAYSQTVAMCPGGHWKMLPDGGRELVTTSALARILKRPNDYESMSDFLMNLTDRLYRDGEAFAYAPRNDRQEVAEIHRMRFGRPYVGDDGSIYYGLSGNEVVDARFDLSYPVPARDVLHVRLRTPKHPLKGVSPILAVAVDQALAGAAMSQQVAFYLNQARPSIMLETDAKLTKEQTIELRELWDLQTKGEKAGGTPILTNGLKAKAIGQSANDSKLADMLKLSDQNIALAFRMPLQILGIGGTPFASTESLMSAWKSTGLGFALNHIEEAFGLLFKLKGMPDEYLEFDTDALLRSSFKEMIDALTTGAGKVMTRNEARAKIGLGKKEGGDDLYVQMQDIPLAMAAELQQQTLNAEPAPTVEEQARLFGEATRTAVEPIVERVEAVEVAQREAIAAIPDRVLEALPAPLERDDTEDAIAAIKRGWETAIEAA